jgi:hypothetical protein
LAFGYAGFLSLPAMIYYLIRGAVEGAYAGLTKGKKAEGPERLKEVEGKKKETSDFWDS